MIDGVADVRRKLRALAEARVPDSLFLSVTVSTSRLDDWRQSAPVFLRSELHHVVAERRLSKGESRAIQSHLDYVLDLLKYEITAETQGVAVYAHEAPEPYERVELPLRLANRLTLEPSPYVRPLAHALCLLQPFVIARVSRDESSLLAVDEWGVASEDDLAGPWLRSSDREAGEVSIKEYYAAARQDTLVDLHFKEVAGALAKLLDLSGSQRVVLCAQHDIAAAFRRALSAPMKKAVVAEIPHDAAASLGQMVASARHAVEGARQQAMVGLAGRIKEGLNPGGHGVCGFDEVLGALQRSQLQILLVDSDYEPAGWLCTQCSWAGLAPVERCPSCGGTVTPATDVLNELICLAVKDSCEIEIGENIPVLGELGGVAGVLRYA
jgi:hypothetical protein